MKLLTSSDCLIAQTVLKNNLEVLFSGHKQNIELELARMKQVLICTKSTEIDLLEVNQERDCLQYTPRLFSTFYSMSGLLDREQSNKYYKCYVEIFYTEFLESIGFEEFVESGKETLTKHGWHICSRWQRSSNKIKGEQKTQ